MDTHVSLHRIILRNLPSNGRGFDEFLWFQCICIDGVRMRSLLKRGLEWLHGVILPCV
jgi:hypothetical protein